MEIASASSTRRPCVVGESDRDLFILHRRVLKYGSFTSTTELTRDVLRFVAHWNRREAHPFRWTFTGEFKLPIAA